MWYQKQICLPSHCRGCHLVTSDIVGQFPELKKVNVGMLHIFIQHSSASLTINENADPDVRDDLEMAISIIAPEDFPYTHTAEGRDDMPAHVKASMFGSSLLIPVTEGRLALGTWQGIYLCEHRNRPHTRKLVLTLQGE